ncbi:unnamed protein product [Chironomus riparius]|uniref:Huntingtin n=1 Tax=Chironomus riparius TaxID=315576 RepID=A0A9N9S192_9DIPT|nr:unnamed protein product [Chironomus riparius]
MDKLTFQKAIDKLKNTECSSKEKIQKFDQIYQSLSSLINNSNYCTYLKNAIQVLLLFCEDNDSNVRISAEENLNRIIRNCEKNHQFTIILIELYHEIKKNGNERSLRICLNLFSHYCHHIKHRKRKVYAQNLVPCMLEIGKRRESLVIETFVDFIKAFSMNLLNCLSDYEVIKVTELFIDNLSVECAIKRRCAAQNIVTILEYSSKKVFVLKTVVIRAQENLSKNHQNNNPVLGTLGLLRLLVPHLIDSNDQYQKVIEILETCLNFLKNETNHSLINANLEVVNSILVSSISKSEMKEILCDDDKMVHKEMLLSRRTAILSSSYESRKSSAETIKMQDSFLQVPHYSMQSTPNKSIGDFSDVEGDSFKSTDFDANVPTSSSPNAFKNVIGAAETMSIKSTDSINSFFNTILTHSNTDAVTKFFRKSSTDSPVHQSKMSESADEKSLDLSLTNLKDDSIEVFDSQTLPETGEMAIEDDTLELTVDTTETACMDAKELFIGSLYDQCVVDYIVRLISSKFLLDGLPKALISDQIIRVSIKNLALSVISVCVELKKDVLLLKLSKDFTDESMMVESLLSFLIDEDIRLEDEDNKKTKSNPHLEVAQATSSEQPQSFLEIKDDHFGECTTATFLDYFSPLNNNLDDQGLISLKNRMYEEKTKDRDESTKKINRELCQLLSRSEGSDSKKLTPMMETTLKLPEDKDCQYIVDILLYAAHGDPVLRANVYTIIGNFIKSVLERNLDYNKVISRNEYVRHSLKFSTLIDHLLNGIRDEINSVVKQTLVAWENCINLMLAVMNESEIENVLNKLLMTSYNKYWLVQCKYCDVITKINIEMLGSVIGVDRADSYEKLIRQQLFILIKDNDFRVRNHSSESLSDWILYLTEHREYSQQNEDKSSLKQFVEQNLIKSEALIINLSNDHNPYVELKLSTVLYELSNLLMEIKDKNQQFGTIYAIKVMIRKFSPSSYGAVWKEFNILNILLSFINKNPGIALDISCQCDMLEFISSLIAVECLNTGNVKDSNNEFIKHLMKILNIYTHLISNMKLVIIPKTMGDLFISTKEHPFVNNYGHFSSDHFYLKFYLVLKSSYDSYRMTINPEAEVKLRQLLHFVMLNLQILLESRLMVKTDNELIEEIVGYLNHLIGFQPKDSIMTTKVLLKFLFQRNFHNRKSDIDEVSNAAVISDTKTVFEKFEIFSTFDSVLVTQNSDNLIKLFDPLVIHSLRLFTKSNAVLQTKVLDMLCQLLEFNINYMKLDAKKVFVDIVLKQIDYIEDGCVVDSEILAPKVVEFLIYLTKLKEKKILTMPKVINIIDNMLASANGITKKSGVDALKVLIIDLFFHSNKIPANSEPEIIEAYFKDINAQREVAISMLMKFIHYKEIQTCFEWIMMKIKVVQSDIQIDENELYQNLVQNLKEDSTIEGSFISSIAKNILIESKNFKTIIGHYWKLLDSQNDSALDVLICLQNNIINIAEEIYLINHIRLHHQKQENDGDAIIKFLKSHLNFIKFLIGTENVDVLKLNKFIRFLKFDKYATLKHQLTELLDVKLVIESSRDMTLKSVMYFFLLLDITSIDIDESLGSSTILINKPKILDQFHKNLFDVRKNISNWESNEIMKFFKDTPKIEVLLNHAHDSLLKSLLEDEEISRIVIRKLTAVKISANRLKFILENVHESCLIDSLIFLISFASNNESKILQLVIVKKLSLIKNKMILNSDENPKISTDELERMKAKLIDFKLDSKYMILMATINDLIKFLKKDVKVDVDFAELTKNIDENWLLQEVEGTLSSNFKKPLRIAEVLYEIKSESKLSALLSHESFNIDLFSTIIQVSFKKMLKNFRVDCIQINPHLNYMKMPPLLKAALNSIGSLLNENLDNKKVVKASKILLDLMDSIKTLHDTALIYVEAKYAEKFITENILKPTINEALLKFLQVMINRLNLVEQKDILVKAIQSVYANEIINIKEVDDALITWIYNLLQSSLINTDFIARYQHPQLFDELENEETKSQIEVFKQAIFIAKLQEAYTDGEFRLIYISSYAKYLIELSLDLSRYVLRINKFYQFTVTPYEILLSYRSGDDLLDKTKLKLKQIPIEYLSDSDLLERYVRRINRYGYTQRQEFEEIFMTLLVMLNQFNDMQDAEEQFYIKQLCLQTNIDLLLTCYRYTSNDKIGSSNFGHINRHPENWSKIDVIGVKKLHHIQELLSSNLNVFYQPNLERVGGDNNVIMTDSYDMNQFSLNYTWNMTNEVPLKKTSYLIKNLTYIHAEKFGIDYKSALHLVYDIMTQMIDENYVLILPQLAKLIDVLDNNDQFRWINKKMLAMHESVCALDTISHQYIVYLLCRSSAVLVPSLSEIQQLIAIINKYLACNHMFVRNATLHGLLCLFEVLNKTNTTIGGINDEIKLLRTAIVNYTNKNGIIYECSATSSTPRHDKLVWSLNFYVIENTLKFGDCNELLIDTIISANNVLKRSNDIDLYFTIINGLERLIIVDTENRLFREKIEKLSIDLIKNENKNFALGGLKLLVTCMYIGSLEQLENTEKSNGIVQDEPEIVMQYTEKIDILFGKIRNSTQDEAEVFGRVLGQILKDLLSPNEILTKIIKELLIMNQSNTNTIAIIIHQVFRTAIDSSFLPLLQEWLICSLPNFLNYPNNKKSIQFLTLIFMSSTLNQHLLKLFPIIIDDDISNSQLNRLFIVSAKDFYGRLSNKQQLAFRDAFRLSRMQSSTSPTKMFNESLFQGLLKNL